MRISRFSEKNQISRSSGKNQREPGPKTQDRSKTGPGGSGADVLVQFRRLPGRVRQDFWTQFLRPPEGVALGTTEPLYELRNRGDSWKVPQGFLGGPWGVLGASWASRGRLGRVLGPPKGLLGVPGGILGPSWGVLEPSGASFSVTHSEHVLGTLFEDLFYSFSEYFGC